MDTQGYGAPISNLPPLAWLSGLNLGEVGLSGEQQPSLGGGAPGTQMPGMEGGLGLDALSELLQAQQGTGEVPGVGTMPQGIGGTVGQGTLAQGQGYFSGGAQSGTGEGAGQQGGYQTAGQTGGGEDPMQVLRQALGIVSKIGSGLGKTAGYESEPGGESQLGDIGQINPSGYSLTGQGAAPEGSPESLAKYFTGQLGGQNLLNDPMLMELFTSGKLQGMLNGPSTEDILGAGGYRLSGRESPENIFAAPGGSAGFSLGGDTQLDTSLGGAGIASPTNWGGALMGGAQGAGGLVNLLQAIQGGNVQQGIGGGLQGIGGLASILKSSPELAGALGMGGEAVSGLGQAAGGAGSLLGLAGGIQAMLNGQYGPGAVQLASSLLSAYPQVASLLGTGAGAAGAGAAGGASTAAGAMSALGAIYGLMGQGDPTGGAQAGAALTGIGATAPAALASSLGPALAGTVGGTLGAIAPIVAAIISYYGNQDIVDAQRSWVNRGQPVTQLKERAETGIGGANTMFDQIAQYGINDQDTLMRALATGANALHSVYWNPQGAGSNPYTIGEYFKHTGEDSAALQQDTQRLQNSLYDTIQRLQTMGVTPEQFGQLNVNPLWGEAHLGGTPVAANRPGVNMANLGQMDAGQAAIANGSWLSPTATNTATGGPLMSMLAYLNPALYQQVGGGFNYSDPGIQEELARPQEYANLINQQAYQDFTSGGG